MLQMLSSVMSHDEVASIVFDPKILDSDKEKLITDILNKDLTPEGVNLVKLLVENKRLAIVGTISKLFDTVFKYSSSVMSSSSSISLSLFCFTRG